MADAAAPVQAADSAPTEDLQQETVASAQGAGATAAETASGPETTRAASSSGSMLLDQIDKLKAEQVALKATKAKLAKEMKNAVTRKKKAAGSSQPAVRQRLGGGAAHAQTQKGSRGRGGTGGHH